MNIPHILIIDDEPGVLETCARALRRQGFQITTASNAQIAHQFVSILRLDLVISDIRMPGQDGISLLQEIRQAAPELPLMIITAYPDSEYVDRAIGMNVKSFIAKPFNMTDFVNEVKRCLNLNQPHRPEPEVDLSQFLHELRKRQIPVLQGRLARHPEHGRLVLSLKNSQGQIAVEEWLNSYTNSDVYLFVLPQPAIEPVNPTPAPPQQRDPHPNASCNE